MVDNNLILSLLVSSIICFLIPLGAFIYFFRLKNKTILPFLVGMLVFFISQIVLRIPILSYVLPRFDWYFNLSINPFMYGIFLGLTAGLFEEIGRYLAFKYMLSKNHRYIDGISFGFGHGGIEAILIVGIPIISTLITAIMINNNLIVDKTLINQVISINTSSILMGGIERILAMIIHIGLSVIVLHGVRFNQIKYLGLAILLHTLVNAPLVILPQVFNVGTLGLEMYVFLWAMIMIFMIFKFRSMYKTKQI